VGLRRILQHPWVHQAKQRTLSEFRAFGIVAIFFALSLLAKPYEETTSKVDQNKLTLSKRLGYAILHRAGYIQPIEYEASPEANSDSDTDEKTRERWVYQGNSHQDFACIEPFPIMVLPSGQVLDPTTLTKAIIAAEKYNRNSLRRNLESQIARFLIPFMGKLPDFSYGLAQIKAETARSLMQLDNIQMEGSELLDFIADDCQNIRLASEYTFSLLEEVKNDSQEQTLSSEERRQEEFISTEEVIQRVASKYNGSSRESISGLRYIDAVNGAYNILAQEVSGTYIPSWREEFFEQFQPLYIGCASFEVNNVTLKNDISWEKTDWAVTNLELDNAAELGTVYIFLRSARDPMEKVRPRAFQEARKRAITNQIMEDFQAFPNIEDGAQASGGSIRADRPEWMAQRSPRHWIFLEWNEYSVGVMDELCWEDALILIRQN
jgi:hypothetical protein